MNIFKTTLLILSLFNIVNAFGADHLPVTTPHLFMWFNNGQKIPSEQLPLPHKKEAFDYYTRLLEECEKLRNTMTPVYLVYKGKLLTTTQRVKMEALSDEIDNLFVIDYDNDPFVQWTLIGSTDSTDTLFIKKINDSTEQFVTRNGISSHPKFPDSIGSIAHLVDITRLFLVYRCDALKAVAYEKYKDLAIKHAYLPTVDGLVYRDFDVVMKSDVMERLDLLDGRISSTNRVDLLQKKLAQLERVLQDPLVLEMLAHDQVDVEETKANMTDYYEQLLSDPSEYARLFYLFAIPDDDNEEERQRIEKQFLELSHCITDITKNKTFCSEYFSHEYDGTNEKDLSNCLEKIRLYSQLESDSRDFAFAGDLVWSQVHIENSFIGVSTCRYKRIKEEMLRSKDLMWDSDRKGNLLPSRPYTIMQDAFLPDHCIASIEDYDKAFSAYIASCITNVESTFRIGRDYSWTNKIQQTINTK